MEDSVETTVNFLKVLADSTRLKIINLLKGNERTVQEIQDLLNRSQSTISQQLKILTSADLLEVRQEGAKKYFKIRDPQIFELVSMIESFIFESQDPTAQAVLDTLHK